MVWVEELACPDRPSREWDIGLSRHFPRQHIRQGQALTPCANGPLPGELGRLNATSRTSRRFPFKGSASGSSRNNFTCGEVFCCNLISPVVNYGHSLIKGIAMTANLSPRFRRRYGPFAESVAAGLTRTFGHLAVAKLVEIHDDNERMGFAETAFALDMRAADSRRQESLVNAQRMFGHGSTAYLATERLASNRRADDYQRALDKYEAAVEAEDQGDDAPALMAAE